MRTYATVHMKDDEEYAVSVRPSLEGGVSLSVMGDLTIFCKPEQALKLAADILQGVISLPKLTAEEQAKADEEARAAIGF